MRKTIVWAGLIFTTLAALLPAALAGGVVTYQARVQDHLGADLDGPVTIGFRIYDSISGSTVIWGETQGLTAVKGIIMVELGRVNALPDNLFTSPGLYLGITAGGDPEMTPRSRLVSTWKAMSTGKASGKTVQAGGATLNVSRAATGAVAITFPKPFSSAPAVMIGAPSGAIGGASFVPTLVTDTTTTGCTAHFASLDGSSAAGSANFDWIAIGE